MAACWQPDQSRLLLLAQYCVSAPSVEAPSIQYVSALLVSDADKEQYAYTRDRSAPPVVSSVAMTNCVIASLMAYRGFRYLIDDRYRADSEHHLTF